MDASNRFTEGLARAQARESAELIGQFTEWYCRGNHKDAERTPLVSDGVELGIYGHHTPVVCESCAQYIRYSEKRTAFCQQDPKPFCAHCEIKCYKQDMREMSKQIMRYSGPRALFSRYAPQAIAHLVGTYRHNRTH